VYTEGIGTGTRKIGDPRLGTIPPIAPPLPPAVVPPSTPLSMFDLT
jgi:hypothetical protein